MAEKKGVPLTVGLVREIADELREFNNTLVVKIYFRLPDQNEMKEIQDAMLNLAMKGE